MTNFISILHAVGSSSLVSMLLANESTVGQRSLGGRGSCALGIHRQSIQAAVDCQGTIVLDGGIQGNVTRTGGLGCRVAVAGQGALLEASNALTGSLISAHARRGTNLYSPNASAGLASMCFTCMPFTRMKPFLTSSRHVFTQYTRKNL